MLAEIPIISPLFQTLLDGIGWVLAFLYDIIPNYGISIIILTLLIRFLLVPLGIKQIKSMQMMQAIQPRVKDLQKKYKGNKQKIQEETMKLYSEAGVNPLGGCLPLLLQFPILISMYAVLRAPSYEPVTVDEQPAYAILNNHLPTDSTLFQAVITHEGTGIAVANLQCSAAQAGTQAVIKDTKGEDLRPDPLVAVDTDQPIVDPEGQQLTAKPVLDCGNGIPAKIPYFLLLAFMIATTFYQQRQMQKASPPGASSQQQQMLLRVMPLMFGIFGFTFPAGLVLYWTFSNLFQIGQQTLLMRAGHIGPDALDKRIAEQKAKQTTKPDKQGFLSRMMERAEEERSRKDGTATTQPRPKSLGPKKPPPKGSGSAKGGSSKGSSDRGSSGQSRPAGRPRPNPKDKPTGGDDA
jgi:YidC/Oxa1 family membrane protein insertase